MRVAGPTAALAGVPAGIQGQGPWVGRRQLFVRFAAEAETATMYTADALAQEIRRCVARSSFHSVSIGGRDPLANADFLAVALERLAPAPLPVMLDCDGMRAAAIEQLLPSLALLQLTIDPAGSEPAIEQAVGALVAASKRDVAHALVLALEERASDGQILRVVEQAHAASEGTQVVIHPPTAQVAEGTLGRDRRWITLMERITAVHADARFLLRLPPPIGMR